MDEEIKMPDQLEVQAWKAGLAVFDNELKDIEKKFNDTKNAQKKAGFGLVYNDLKSFRGKFEKHAESELASATFPVDKDILVDEFAKISQRMDDMEDQIILSGGIFRYPLKLLKKPLKKIGGLFRRKR